MSASAFGRRRLAAEGQWVSAEERLATLRHLERMVDQVSAASSQYGPIAR